MDTTVIMSILSMAGLGLFFASVLAVVNQKLKVTEDPNIEKIAELLPGVNCGACGFANCRQYAEALVTGKASAGQCRAGSSKLAACLSEILGVKVEEKVKKVAIVHCGADAFKRKKKAHYIGVKTCKAAHGLSDGENLCGYGCLGYGDCMKACPFGAITMINGLPKIDSEKCTACGKCVTVCPLNLISIEDAFPTNLMYVACNNPDKGIEMRKTCPVGCIACGLCQKLTNGIFYIENNLARVRYDKLSQIGNREEVIEKCPTKCIMEHRREE